MKLYIGYIMLFDDRPVPVAASTKGEEVEKFLNENFNIYDDPYVEEYDLNSFIKFDV